MMTRRSLRFLSVVVQGSDARVVECRLGCELSLGRLEQGANLEFRNDGLL